MIVLVAIATLMISGSIAQNENLSPNNVCKLMVDGTRIRDIDSCENYYVCKEGLATHYSCPNGKQFNKDRQECTAPELSTCGYDPEDVDKMCVGVAPKTWLADPSSCDGFYYCATASSKPQKGACLDGQDFNEDKQACVNSDESTCTKGSSGNPDSKNAICAIVPDRDYFGVATDCKKWAVCEDGKYSNKDCGENTKFNTEDGSCDYTSKCIQTSGPTVPGGADPDPDYFGGPCLATEVGNYKTDGTCSGFYYCNAQLKWIRGVCENYRAFDGKKCVNRSDVLCEKPCQNTKGSSLTWVNDPEDCNNYLVCTENQATYKGTCGTKSYYSVSRQRCLNELPDNYKACPWVPKKPSKDDKDEDK